MAYDRGCHEWNELAYQTYLEETRKEMDSEISSLIRKVANLRLNDKIVYVLQTRGKLLRPTLVLLSGQSVGADKGPLKKLALAIELLHEATLVHDDILDDDSFRRNAVAVHAKWGVRDAILVGDALASLSLNLAAEYGKEISKIVSHTCLLLCDGEYMDAVLASAKLSEPDYFEKITKKSATLFKTATLCGAIVGGGSSFENDALAEFGENFGIAYQIRDDLSDIASLREGVTPSLNDFQTLPLIYMNDAINCKGKKFLRSCLSARAEKDSERQITPEKLYKCLEKAGSIAYCTDKIKDYVNKAIASLEPLKKSVYRSYIVKMADSLKIPTVSSERINSDNEPV
ncbi:MAG: polyprenyl synthetase family protein [Candidatus Bathyarchaeia archaeon]|jgi:geranylgeranyl pyrophosphate synthase